MVEQAEILEHDADALAQIRDLVLAELRDVVAEQIDEAARRSMREEQQAQQRGFAGAGRAGEKLKGMRRDMEAEVAQDLGPQAVTQSDIFEPNQVQLRSREGAGDAAVLRHTRSTGFATVMVSGSLTVAL
ncbi:phosphoserine phosphatase [Bradyrhizobium sp. LB13.1]